MSAHSSVKGRLPMPAFDASHHVCHYAAQGMGLRKRLWPVAARYTGPENSGYFHRLHFGQKNLPGLSQSILQCTGQRVLYVRMTLHPSLTHCKKHDVGMHGGSAARSQARSRACERAAHTRAAAVSAQPDTNTRTHGNHNEKRPQFGHRKTNTIHHHRRQQRTDSTLTRRAPSRERPSRVLTTYGILPCTSGAQHQPMQKREIVLTR